MKRKINHKSVVKPGVFEGSILTTTLCGRMDNTNKDGMNISDEITCKFCLKLISREKENNMKTLIQQNKQTGQFRIKGPSGITSLVETKDQALKAYKKLEYNQTKRERNQILSDLTGTSARAAKLDMGL